MIKIGKWAIPMILVSHLAYAQSFGGHSSSNGDFVPVRPSTGPAMCNAAKEEFSHVIGNFMGWIRVIKYGPHNKRTLHQNVAHSVSMKLRSYGLQTIRNANMAYRLSSTPAQSCVDVISIGREEFLRTEQLIRAEAKKGNYYLDGTGLLN